MWKVELMEHRWSAINPARVPLSKLHCLALLVASIINTFICNACQSTLTTDLNLF